MIPSVLEIKTEILKIFLIYLKIVKLNSLPGNLNNLLPMKKLLSFFKKKHFIKRVPLFYVVLKTTLMLDLIEDI